MEDRYLFKAKRVDDGEWIVGGLVRYGFTGKEKYYIVPDYASDLYAMEIDQNTICQCTGLKDKNSNLIWENDVVDFKTSKAVDDLTANITERFFGMAMSSGLPTEGATWENAIRQVKQIAEQLKGAKQNEDFKQEEIQ